MGDDSRSSVRRRYQHARPAGTLCVPDEHRRRAAAVRALGARVHHLTLCMRRVVNLPVVHAERRPHQIERRRELLQHVRRLGADRRRLDRLGDDAIRKTLTQRAVHFGTRQHDQAGSAWWRTCTFHSSSTCPTVRAPDCKGCSITLNITKQMSIRSHLKLINEPCSKRRFRHDYRQPARHHHVRGLFRRRLVGPMCAAGDAARSDQHQRRQQSDRRERLGAVADAVI